MRHRRRVKSAGTRDSPWPAAIAGMGSGRWGLRGSCKRDDGQVSASRVVLDVEHERDPGLTPNENLG